LTLSEIGAKPGLKDAGQRDGAKLIFIFIEEFFCWVFIFNINIITSITIKSQCNIKIFISSRVLIKNGTISTLWQLEFSSIYKVLKGGLID
jgi:hypothetical protein